MCGPGLPRALNMATAATAALDRHRAHMMPSEQEWDPAGGADAVVEHFQTMRGMHASQLLEPVQYSDAERAVLAQLSSLTPGDFVAALAGQHPQLRDKLCGISATGQTEAKRREQLAEAK